MPSLRARLRGLASVGAAAAILALPGRALGDESLDRCVDAHTRAQSLRRTGKLAESREALKQCVDAGCPSLVRDDCTQLLDDLDRAQPTIVFDVRDDAGHDLTEVKIGIDGRPFADSLTGVALAADPGTHLFTFESAGRATVTAQIVVREGEKNRREGIVLKGVVSSPAADASSLAPMSSDSSPRRTAAATIQKAAAVVAGGLGVAAVAVGGVLALLAKSKSDDANAFCPDVRCPNSQALNMNREALRLGDSATIVLVAGAAGVAAGALLWVTAPSPSKSATVAIGLSGGGVAMRGTW